MVELRELFSHDKVPLLEKEQQSQLAEAMVILSLLCEAVSGAPRVRSRLNTASEHESVRKEFSSKLWCERPIRFVRGVGPKRMSLLQRLEIETVEDALWTVPWRYEDRSVMTLIDQLVPGVEASICGVVIRSEMKNARNRRFAILEVVVEDSSGCLQAVFF